jgi:hypothetical protein
MAISVINDENNNQNTTVYANHAQNSSFHAKVIIPNIVVRELMTTGLNLVLPASTIASVKLAHKAILLLILSIIKIALLTTIPISDINHIINGML